MSTRFQRIFKISHFFLLMNFDLHLQEVNDGRHEAAS